MLTPTNLANGSEKRAIRWSTRHSSRVNFVYNVWSLFILQYKMILYLNTFIFHHVCATSCKTSSVNFDWASNVRYYWELDCLIFKLDWITQTFVFYILYFIYRNKYFLKPSSIKSIFNDRQFASRTIWNIGYNLEKYW